MIVYRELSSLTRDLGFSAKALYSVSYHRASHYRTVNLPKADGSVRALCVPDEFLLAIQRSIAGRLLVMEPISPYALAYRPGGSTLKNAAPHVGKPLVLKLDIRHFFDCVIYPIVKERAFPAHRYSEANRILLTMLCTYRDALPQGAPTSPAISNIILREFDDAVGAWCSRRGIAYTRYCDDMTFSGDFDPRDVKAFVSSRLRKMGFFLNSKKTVAVRQGQRQTVTGLVVNEKISVPCAHRRKLRQELYFCQKYGIADHLRRRSEDTDPQKYAMGLLGKVNYALQTAPADPDLRNAKVWLLAQIQK